MKKNEQVTVRMTEELKLQLQDIADKHRWTISQTAMILLEEAIKESEALIK